MHWINFPVLFIMIWSGLLIYWNDSDNAYQHPHAVYRVGFGHVTLFRFFPDWFYNLIHAQYHVTQGLGNHFFFMWIFALNGIALGALYRPLGRVALLPRARPAGDPRRLEQLPQHDQRA